MVFNTRVMFFNKTRSFYAYAFLTMCVCLPSFATDPAAPVPAFATKPAAPANSEEANKLMTQEDVMKELGPQTGLFSGDVAYNGKNISSVAIHYVNQNRTVHKDRLLDVVQTKAGTKYSSDVINRDLERLANAGVVGGNTRVAVEGNAETGLRVIFEVTAQELLGGVGFRGNVAIPSNDLSEETELKAGQILSDKSLALAKTKLLKLYQEERYPDAQIDWQHLRTERPGTVDLLFNIKEGKRTDMMDIEFVGNHKFDSTTLRQVMKTKEKGPLTWITKSGRINREELDDDLNLLQDFYRNNGYLRARLAKVEYFDVGHGNASKLKMRIQIQEGPQYKVNQVSFGPTRVFTPAELEPGLSMYNGDIYSAKRVANDVTMIRRYYGSRGYADAYVQPEITEAGGKDSSGRPLINICYRIEEGDPYRVGNINVVGNTKTKSHVIIRELPLKPNDPLNSVDMETGRKRLQNMNYFHNVEVTQASSARPGYRDINVEVIEKPTGMFNVGVAFSTIESVYLFASITQSNFDLYDWGKFVGGGQRMTLSGKLGTEFTQVSLSWLDPWFLHRRLALGVEFYYSDSNYYSDYYQQINYGATVSLRRSLGDNSAVKLAYTLEQYDLEVNGGAPFWFQYMCNDKPTTRSHIELSYEYDTRDAQITPRKGGKFGANVGYSGPGSSVETYGMGLEGSKFWNLRWDSIFSVKAAASAISLVNQDDTLHGRKAFVPLYERLYLGGPNDMRGFRYRDVAPYNSDYSGDETMGGLSSFFIQFELTVPIIEEVRFAVFYDLGFVQGMDSKTLEEKPFQFGHPQWASDFGFGLRMNLPIGPLAVDYAIPIKVGNAVDNGGQFQFYVNYSY